MPVWTPPANWTTKTALLHKAPVYILRFDGLASVQYSSGPVTSASRTTKQYLAEISSLSQSFDVLSGQYSVGGVSAVLVDKSYEITDLIGTEKTSPTLATLLNRKVTILLGYADLTEADYTAIFVGYISDLRLLDDKSAYEFELTDIRQFTVRDIFTNANAGGSKVDTTLTAAVSAGAIRLDVASAANVAVDDDIFIRQAATPFNEDKVKVGRVDEANRVFYLRDETPTTFAFASGDSVRWAATKLVGNPINIFYSLLTGTFSTSGSFPLASYSGQPTGLGIAAGDIDTAGLIIERDDWLTNMVLTFEMRSPESAAGFLGKEIFRLFGFPVVTPDGKLSFKAFGPRKPTDAVLTMTASDMIEWSWRRRYDLAYNRVTVKFDYDPENSRYISSSSFNDTATQATVGVSEMIVQSRGIRTGVNAEYYLEQYARRFLTRYARGAAELRAKLFMTHRALYPGLSLDVTHAAAPNVRTALRGLAAAVGVPAFELSVVKHDPRTGIVEIVAADNGWTRPGFIAQSGLPNYSSATSEQKRKNAYISPPSGANFSDGSTPYKVI